MRGVFPPVSGSYDGSPADRFGDDIERLFFPEFSAMHNRVPPSALLIYNARKQIRQLQVRRPRTGAIERDQRTVVVSIDGACRDNGRPAARASWGVFLGPGSRYNDCGLLRRGVPQTSSRAEIEALAQALEIVWEFTRTDMRLTQVLIRSDSEYLCQAMSMWIQDWIDYGGVRSNGQPVAHFEKLEKIHDTIDDMVYGDDGGLDIRFWHVPRRENREADVLANMALDWYG